MGSKMIRVSVNSADPPVVQIFIKDGNNPEQLVREFTVSERGKIKNFTAQPLDLSAYRGLANCLGGPALSDPPKSCDSEAYHSADYDENNNVDLRDYAFIQNSIVGS
jgi:hypothetical protein